MSKRSFSNNTSANQKANRVHIGNIIRKSNETKEKKRKLGQL